MGFWICMAFFALAIGMRIYLPIRDRKLAAERRERWKAFQARYITKS
jgi:hypothetical protein